MKNKFRIKSFIRNQFPEYVRRDHPVFVDFMEAYFEWLDNNPYALRSASNLENIFDIDETLEIFLDDFKKTYINSFPINLAINPVTGKMVDAKILIKNIKNFYRSKGIKNSYRFIFRIIYNSEIDIYYPKEFIMNLSDGRWVNEKILYVRPSNLNISSLVGRTICQRSSPLDRESPLIARARVLNSIIYLKRNNYVLELSLGELFGNFSPNYPILDFENGKNYGNSYSILRDVLLENQGFGYVVGQKINFVELTSGFDGELPKAKIRRVSSGSGESKGKVLSLDISDPGLLLNSENCGISSGQPIDLGGFTGGTGFIGQPQFGAIFDKREYYLGEKGLLSSTMVLQDNYKYQEYSYVIRSEMPISRYLDLVKGLLHPAGVQILGEILISRCIQATPSTIVNIPKRNIKMIGNYLPYTFLTFDNLEEWLVDSNGNPACYNSSLHDNLIICGNAQCITGNPISSNVNFVEAPGASCTTSGVPSDYPRNFWDTLPHPNKGISIAIGLIYENQLEDFYGNTKLGNGQSSSGWQEWNFSNRNGGTISQQEEWLEDTLNSQNGRNFAGLRIDLGTEFRKIPIYAFLNEVNCTYDCRYTNNCVEPNLYNKGKQIVGPSEDYAAEDKIIISGEATVSSARIIDKTRIINYL